MNAAVAYLESAEYETIGWEQGIPEALVQLRGTFGDRGDIEDIHVSNPIETHLDVLCDNHNALCTGDGYRWHPTLPVLRFR